jgi:hypothetical protein
VVFVQFIDEDDLYATLDDLCARQEKIELALYRLYQRRRGEQPPHLFLYNVTSSYLEGACNELREFDYNCDGKRGKPQIVIGPSRWRCAYLKATPPIRLRWSIKSRSSKSSSKWRS